MRPAQGVAWQARVDRQRLSVSDTWLPHTACAPNVTPHQHSEQLAAGGQCTGTLGFSVHIIAVWQVEMVRPLQCGQLKYSSTYMDVDTTCLASQRVCVRVCHMRKR